MEHASKRFLQVPVNKVCSGQKLTIYRDGSQLGEWLETEVRELYKDGLLLPGDLFWREGMKDRQPLHQFVKTEPRRHSSLFRRQ